MPVIYQDGLVFGGRVYVDSAYTRPAPEYPLRVNGSTYSTGTRQGWIVGSGATARPVDPADARLRVYIASSSSYVSEYDAAAYMESPNISDVWSSIDLLSSRYSRDLADWPAALGAPYIERNGLAGYQPPDPELSRDARDLVARNVDQPGPSGPSGLSYPEQTLWMVYNDLDVTTTMSFAGSPPMGLEIQKTVWVPEWSSGVWEAYLTRTVFINKGGVDTSSAPGLQAGSFWIDSMYVEQWSDPDVGTYSNDLAGCDTTLAMTYAYNADVDAAFSMFGLAPAAVGYQVLVGPTHPVSGSRAIRNFQWQDNVRSVSMTSCIIDLSGDFLSTPPTGPSPNPPDKVIRDWWSYMRGFVPIGAGDQRYPSGPFAPSPFVYSGDPVGGTGWLAGKGTSYSFPPGDVRMHMGIGPFRLAPGDTQEVIIATLAGLGADRLSSITALRYNARRAKTLAENLFEAPTAPSAPAVNAVALDRAVLLEWGSDRDAVAATETYIGAGSYAFEGYNVYQLPLRNQTSNRKRIATMDRVNGITRIDDHVYDYDAGLLVYRPLQQGTDAGVRRYVLISKDFAEQPLVNGREYHFAVSAYSYSPDSTLGPRSLESSPVILSVTPGKPVDRDLTSSVGDTLAVSHDAGASSTLVIPVVVDPTAGTGDTYEVRFDTSAGQRTWRLINRTRSQTVLTGQPDQLSMDDVPIVPGGVLIIIQDRSGAPAGPSDVYSFIIPRATTGPEVEKQNVKRAGVFPNPVYLTNDDRIGAGGARKVTFTSLPQKATIRIFNLAGHLVRTIHKDSPSQYLDWDLTNDDNWLVASGMYIVYLEFTELKTNGVLKLGVIQGYPVR